MSSASSALKRIPPIHYPDSDGKRMAENTVQLRWILTLYGNLAALYADRPDVFVAGDNLWYPVEGFPEIATAQDVYVVFGRPKGDRGSYKQWEEANIPLTVVFEILSPGNRPLEMIEKQGFYEDHGVEEYYVYDPDANRLFVFGRRNEILIRQKFKNEWISPRLGIRFDLTGKMMKVFHPDGREFFTFEELNQKAKQAEQRADKAEQRLEVLQRIVELSRKARIQQASAEELQELERLERETAR